MDPLQNSRTNLFRELRIAAACTQRDFAARIGISLPTAARLDRGEQRIAWWILIRLSELSKKVPDHLTERIYGRKIGDPCPCGCGGSYCAPLKDRAHGLWVKVKCADCGTTENRIWTPDRPHSKLCPKCAGRRRRKGEATLRCRTKDCVSEATRRLWEWKKVDSVDWASETYCCDRCTRRSAASRIYRVLRDNAKNFIDGGAARAYSSSLAKEQEFFELTGFYPHENFPKIQTLTRLRQLLRACMKLSYKDPDGNPIVFPARQNLKPGQKQGELRIPADKEAARRAHALGALLMWARRGEVYRIRGYCELCGKILFSDRAGTVRVHKLCYKKHQAISHQRGFPNLPVKQRRAGNVADLQNLRKHYLWFLENRVGGLSFAEIRDAEYLKSVLLGIWLGWLGLPAPAAKRLTRDAVSKGIAAFVDSLPEPASVPRHLRARVSLLRSLI